MTSSDEMIRAIRQNASAIRRDYGVARLGVFGSRVRGDATTDSDLDVLVEFERPTFRNYMGLKHYLEQLLGVTVDLVSAAALKPVLREHVMREVKYVA